MYELFFKKLNEKVSFTKEEEEEFKKYLIPKKLRKRQYILQEGDVSKYVCFVEKGMLRLYSVDEKGTEKIIQFAPEGWYVSDLYSFITGEASGLNIDALEDCELVLITKESMETLRKKFSKYLEFSFLQMQSAYVALQCRLFDTINLSTEEKYKKMIDRYPDIVQRVPQHMVASYLGLTPETLSRTRKGMSLKK